jgi:hypothetical protein
LSAVNICREVLFQRLKTDDSEIEGIHMAQTGEADGRKLRSWKSRGLWIAAALGILLTIAGVALSLVTVNVIPQDEGPPVTGLVGGGPADSGGVTLQIGNYTIVAGSPQYTGTLARDIAAGCANASHVRKGRSSEDVLPLTIDPIGFSDCLADNQNLEAGNGELSVRVEHITEIPAQSSSPGPRRYIPLSGISAQVREPAAEISSEIAALILIAAGPGLVIGALIPIIQERLSAKKSTLVLSSHRTVESKPAGDSEDRLAEPR